MNSYNQSMSPDIVVYPIDIEEIQKIVKLCNEYKVPIIPFGYN